MSKKIYARVPKHSQGEGMCRVFLDGTEIVAGDQHIPFIDGSAAVALQNKRMTIETQDERLVIDIPSMQMPRSTVAWLWIAQSKYRPGDTIRGFIVVRERLNPYVLALRRLQKTEGQVRLVDDRDTIVIARPFQYGGPVASAFEIDTSSKKHLDLGKCKMQLVDKNGTKLASAPVEIVDFKKKELTIVVDHPAWVLEGDDIALSISGKYYHGSNVLSGKVLISVDGKEPDEMSLDESGTVRFNTVAGEKGTMLFKVTITDKDGMQDDAEIPVIVSDKPAIISLVMPPHPVYSTLPFTVRVKVETPDGIPIPSLPVVISLSRISQMTGDRIPGLDPVTVSTSVNGLATAKMTSALDGTFELSAECSANGCDVSAISSMIVARFAKNYVIAINTIDATTIKEGDTIAGSIKLYGLPETIDAITSGFIDLVTDKIVETTRIEIEHGDAKYSFTGVTDFWGTAGVDFYMKPSTFKIDMPMKDADAAGYVHAKQTVIIEPSTPLAISAKISMPGEATTGSEITATVTIDSTLLRDDVHVFGALVDQRVPTAHDPGNIGKTFLESPKAMEVIMKASETKYHASPQTQTIYHLLGSSGTGRTRGITCGSSMTSGPPTPPSGGPTWNATSSVSKTASLSKSFVSKSARSARFQTIDSLFSLGENEEPDSLIGSGLDFDNMPVIERENFAESVIIAPAKINDGTATLKVKLPDSITTYTLVLFVAGTMQFGESRATIVAKNPVFTSVINPAFMTLRDDIATIRAVIRNETGELIPGAVLNLHDLEGLEIIDGKSSIELASIDALGSGHVSWLVRGNKVGMAKVKIDLRTPGFAERVSFDQPLRIRAPGIPVIIKKSLMLSERSPIKEKIVVSEKAAHSDVIISILPSLEVAIIDGMESLAQYPHGCCEQTVASTLPNLIVHDYLKAAGKLTESMDAKLVANMRGGYQRLMNYHNGDGGFSYWGQESTPFYTALAMSAIARIKPHLNAIQPDLFTSARSYLKTQKQGDHWSGRMHGHATFAPVIMDDVSATIFIVHALAEAGLDDIPAFTWLISESRNDDPAVVAMMLRSWAMVPAYKDAFPDAGETLGSALMGLVTDDGRESVSWKKGSAITGAAEATAYAVLALTAAFPDDASKQDIIARAIKYLLDCRSSSGFGSTRDTLYAAMAISTACSGDKPNFTLHVVVNGKEIMTDSVTPENIAWKIYDIRSIHVDDLEIGDNEIDVTIDGKGKCHVTVEQRVYFHESEGTTRDRMIVTVPEKVSEDEEFIVNVEIMPISPMQSVMIDIPAPPVAKLPDGIIPSMIKAGSSHAEVKDGYIHAFFEQIDGKKTINVPMIGTMAGEARIDVVASEMYSSRKIIAKPAIIHLE